MELFGKSAEELGLLPASARPETEETPALPGRPPIWRVPYRRNPFFTGREDTLEHVHSLFQTNKAGQVQALCGLGGVGKTQTALEYAYRYRDAYAAVLWVKADTSENLMSELSLLAQVLDLPEPSRQDSVSIFQIISQWLAQQRNWLLILDNLEDLLLLNEIIPAENEGHTLVTTRAQMTGTLAHCVNLEEMGADEGSLFLLRRAKYLQPDVSLGGAAPADQANAQTIVELVGGLPLALDQAGAYIEDTGCGLQDYLERYHAQRAALLNRRGSLAPEHPESVGATLSLSFLQVERFNPTAAHLLRLCAFLDPDAIPEEIFPAAADALDPVLQPALCGALELDAALAALRRYSLVRRHPGTKTLGIHRLVQAMLRENMDEETQRQWAERAVRAISRMFPDVHDPTTWVACQRFWTQALVGIALIERWELRSADAGRLLTHAGAYLQRVCADYAQAEYLFKRAYVIYRRVLGPAHHDLASCMNKLAVLYRYQKKYPQAERLHQRALRIREQELGPLHPDVGTSLNNLAVLYMVAGKLDLAEKLCQRGLAIREKFWGSEHPEVAISLHNLAAIYYDQRKFTQAEALQQRVLAIREKALGPAHPDLASALNQLATVYQEQKKYDQAEALYQRALAIQEQTLGLDHPSTAETRANFATLLAKMRSEQPAAPNSPEEVLLLSEYLRSRKRG
jgi:tetratricopeptide (TPR) repeat protein